MTPKEKRAKKLRKELKILAKNNPKAQQLITAEEQRLLKKTLKSRATTTAPDVMKAYLHYQTAAINYTQQVDICMLQQHARERLAYDLFLTIAVDSSITPNAKAVIKNISSELVEMIPKVGEFLEVASDTQAAFVEAKIKGSEVNVRYAAIKTSISTMDISDKKGVKPVAITIEQYVRFLLDKSLLVNAAKSNANKKQVHDYYIRAAILVNNKTMRLRDLSKKIQAYIPSNKKKYKAAMSGLLKKTSVAKMFKFYLLQWLNKSGHSITLYPAFTQNGMIYNRDISDIRRSLVVESLNILEKIVRGISIYDYEDTAVTQALVDLKLLKSKNAPITEKDIRAFGLTLPVEYVLDVKYRTNKQ